PRIALSDRLRGVLAIVVVRSGIYSSGWMSSSFPMAPHCRVVLLSLCNCSRPWSSSRDNSLLICCGVGDGRVESYFSIC
ncbi:hypothetical protein A2U01_0046337, partial [Trifolium medium]|nr:hypothetical protein [Trifolium medium]